MQFNSYIFILIFLPVVILLYFLANKVSIFWGKGVLVLGSLVFYAYAGLEMLIILGISVTVNYIFVLLMRKGGNKRVFLTPPLSDFDQCWAFVVF